MTQKELKILLKYDKKTGIFKWKRIKSKRIKFGDIAGGKIGCGYISIRIKGRAYLAHRLAWLYVYGKFPKNTIDHINHNKIDNRICNLRDISLQENLKNQPLRKTNKSGIAGVFFHKARKQWQAYYSENGKAKHLGWFFKKEEAVKCRMNYIVANSILFK